MSDSSVSVYVSTSARSTGEPHVLNNGDGGLQIYPAGTSGPCLFFTPEDWRKLNTAVEAALAAAESQAVSA